MKILYEETIVIVENNQFMFANLWQLGNLFKTTDRDLCVKYYLELSEEEKLELISELEYNLKLEQDDENWDKFLMQLKLDYYNY